MEKQSLRDIKKEATAQALAEAAFKLALERGMDGFVVDEVVQRAGYSRRTFANHYSCKEDAVASAAFTRLEEFDDIMADMPDSTSLLDVLYQLMKTQLTADMLWKMRELVSLSKRHPSLEPYILSVHRRLQIAAYETLRDLSNGRYPDAYVQLLIGAVYGAFMPILDGHLQVVLPGQTATDTHEGMTLDQLLDTIFGYLRNGF